MCWSMFPAEMCWNMFPTKNSSIHLTPPFNLALFFNQFNNTSPEQNVDPENVVNSRYFGVGEMQALKLLDKKSLYLSSI